MESTKWALTSHEVSLWNGLLPVPGVIKEVGLHGLHKIANVAVCMINKQKLLKFQ